MGVDIDIWRVRVGGFNNGCHSKVHSSPSPKCECPVFSPGQILLFLTLSIILCGDVKQNPGPPPPTTHSASLTEKARRLNEFAVPVHNLPYMEHCSHQHVDHTLKRRDSGYTEQIENIGRTTCAMLNHAGGVIVLIPKRPHTEKNLDEWINNIHQHIETFLSKTMFDACIEIKNQLRELEIWIKRCPHHVTYRTNLFIRSGTSTIEVHPSSADQLLNERKTDKYSSIGVIQWNQIVYGDVFEPREGKHLEVKAFSKVNNSVELVERICADQIKGECKVMRTLLAFANTEGGGDLIIGVSQDDDGNRIIQGQHIHADEQAYITQALNQMMANGIDGEMRIFPPDTSTKLNIHFYPVAHSPSGLRHVLIHIRVDQFEKCVFARNPESYMMTDLGQIQSIPYNLWEVMIRKHTNRPTKLGPKVPSPSAKLHQNNDEQPPEYVIDAETSQHLADDLRKHKIALSSRETKSVSWTTDSEHWLGMDECSGYKDMRTYLNELARSDILRPSSPISWFPGKQILHRWMMNNQHQRMADIIQSVEETYTCKAVVFAASYLKYPFPEVEITKPENHVLDLVVLQENCDLDIWVIFENWSSIDLCIEYFIHSHRMLKSVIYGKLHQLGFTGLPVIAMNAFICTMDNVHVSVPSCSPKTTITLEHLQLAVASCLLGGKSYIRNRIGDDYLSILTKDQLSGIVTYNFANVHIINGPPGSGKTVIALHICDKESATRNLSSTNILYICPNESLASYIKYQGKCIVQVVKEGGVLLQVIRSALDNGTLCVIVDDAQLLKMEHRHWIELFKWFTLSDLDKQNTLKLVVLIDPKFQCLDTSTIITLFESKQAFEKENEYCSIVQHPALIEMLRNCRKVFSFFKSNAEGPEKDRLVCRHNFDGDDVSVHYSEDLFLRNQDNALIQLVHEIVNLYNFEEDFVYEEKDVAILVDSDSKEDTKHAVNIYREIFNEFSPLSTLQNAIKVPVEGLILDELQNFSGLEARVCILVLVSEDVSVMDNPCYRLFVASRGITKLVFLLHGKSVANSLQALKFSEEKQWKKLSEELWCAIPLAVMDQPNAESWIRDTVPNSGTWRKRLDVALGLRNMMDEERPVQDIILYMSTYLADQDQAILLLEYVIHKHEMGANMQNQIVNLIPDDQQLAVQCTSVVYLSCLNRQVSIYDWPHENVTGQPETTSTLLQFRLLGFILKGTAWWEIKDWFDQAVPQYLKADTNVLWEKLSSIKVCEDCCKVKDCTISLRMLDEQIVPCWRNEEQLASTSLIAALRVAEHNGYYRIVLSDNLFFSFLGAVDCLSDAPDHVQIQAHNTFDAFEEQMHQNVYYEPGLDPYVYDVSPFEVLRQLYYLGFMKKYNGWQSAYSEEIKPFQVTWRQENLQIFIVNQHNHSAEEMTSILQSSLKITRWFDLPHFQRLMLSLLCQVAVFRYTNGGHNIQGKLTWKQMRDKDLSLNNFLRKYMQFLFCNVKNKHHLLYSVQLVVHQFQYPSLLTKSLLDALLTITMTGQLVFTSAHLMQWMEIEHPPYEKGRDNLKNIMNDDLLDLHALSTDRMWHYLVEESFRFLYQVYSDLQESGAEEHLKHKTEPDALMNSPALGSDMTRVPLKPLIRLIDYVNRRRMRTAKY